MKGAATLGMLFLIFAARPAHAQSNVIACTFEELLAAVARGGTTYVECEETIALTSPLYITRDVTLEASANKVILDGRQTNRLFVVSAGATLRLRGFVLQNGLAPSGGAVLNQGAFFATDCTFSNNVATGVTGAPGAHGVDGPNYGTAGGRGGDGVAGSGGALYNAGTAVCNECLFWSNAAHGGAGGPGGNGGNGEARGGDGGPGGHGAAAYGGGVFNNGVVRLTNCYFLANAASAGPGGASGTNGTGAFPSYRGNGGSGNAAFGGGLYSGYGATVSACTFAYNSAFGSDSAAAGTAANYGPDGDTGGDAFGGGFCNYGAAGVLNCTFVGNLSSGGRGGDGGAAEVGGGDGGDGGHAWGGNLVNAGGVHLTNCTIATGWSAPGTGGAAGSGGLSSGQPGAMGSGNGGNVANQGGTFALLNTILATPGNAANAWGVVLDHGYNLSSDATPPFAGTSRNFAQAALQTLEWNGGPTPTMAITAASAAVNRASPSAFPPVDQRGMPRPAGGRADVGAFEMTTAPLITQQPQSQSVHLGSNVTFRVSAVGAGLSYQWQHASTNLANRTESSLSLTNVQTNNAGAYRVIVDNSLGTITSAVATLTVLTTPSIVTQPVSVFTTNGGTATFSVVAQGTGPLFYQWRFNGTNVLALATNATHHITSVATNHFGAYNVVISNSYGAVTSSFANLILGAAPVIVTHPTNLFITNGGTATFTVAAQGTPLNYQWLFNGAALGIATNSIFSLIGVSSNHIGAYSVIVSNGFGVVTSAVATLSVGNAPLITQSPSNFLVVVGAPVQLSVAASGSSNLVFQWRLNGTNLVTATNTSLVLPAVTMSDAGPYSVVVRNGFGSVTSLDGVLRVTPPVVLTATLAGPSNVAFGFGTVGGIRYLLETQPILSQTNWTTFSSNAPTTAGTISITNAIGTISSAWFRLRLE